MTTLLGVIALAPSPSGALTLAEGRSATFDTYLGPGFEPPEDLLLGHGGSSAAWLYLSELNLGSGLGQAFTLNTGSSVSVGTGEPRQNALEAAWPNPFRNQITLGIALPRASSVSIAVYDIHGARVKQLVDQVLEAGRHVRRWDGRDHTGRAASAGVYFVRFSTPGFAQLRKVVLLR